jgi:hypothetical protein
VALDCPSELFLILDRANGRRPGNQEKEVGSYFARAIEIYTARGKEISSPGR